MNSDNDKRNDLMLKLREIIWIAVKASCGIYGAYCAYRLADCADRAALGLLVVFGGVTLLFVTFSAYRVALCLQGIVHEAGHLVLGKLTGYKFISFQVDRFMLIKSQGRFRLKHSQFSLSAACSMVYEDYKNGDFPLRLYFLGGVLFNALFAAIFLAVKLLCSMNVIMNILLVCLAATGFGIAAANGIPIILNNIASDGYCALNIDNQPEVKYACWRDWTIAKLLMDGARLKDMDEALFAFSDNADISNTRITHGLCYTVGRFMELNDFQSAKQLAEILLSEKARLSWADECWLKMAMICVGIIDNGRNADTSNLKDPAVMQFMTRYENELAVQTLHCGISLINGDETVPREYKAKLEKLKNNFSTPQTIDVELELIALMERSCGSGVEKSKV